MLNGIRIRKPTLAEARCLQAVLEETPDKCTRRHAEVILYYSGRVHWRYYHGKGAQYVCGFMQQVRRWYPDQEV